MDFSILLIAIGKIAVMLGLGMWVGHKVVAINPDIRKLLIFLIIYVTLPALILNGFLQLETNRELLRQLFGIFAFSFIFTLTGLFLGWLIARAFRLSPQKAREAGFLSIFGNLGLIGIPLCATMFGPKGALMAAVFDAGMAPILWSFGAWFVQPERRKMSVKSLKSVINGPIVAIAIGVVIILLDLEPGRFAREVIGTLSGAASPLSMFYIGMLIMAMFKARMRVSLKLLSLPVSLKLIVFPLLALCMLSFLPFYSTEVKFLILILASLPNIATASIIMAMSGADEEYGAMSLLTTTLLSLVTIPLLATIAQWLLLS
jgi:hypothetical protein